MKKITAVLLSAVLASAPVSAVTANAETAEGNYAESYENVLKGFAGENYIHLSFWDEYYGNTAFILDTANKIHIIPSRYHGTVITVEEGTELPVEEITDAAFIAGSATPEITKVDNDTYTLEAIREDQRKLFYDALKNCDCVSRIEEKLVTYEDTVNAFAVQQWYIKTDKGPEALTEEYPELDLVYSPKFKKDAERQGFDYCYTGGLDLSNAYDTLTNMAENGYGFMLSGIMTCLGQDITEEHECTRIVYAKENRGTSGTMRSPENVEEYLRESYEILKENNGYTYQQIYSADCLEYGEEFTSEKKLAEYDYLYLRTDGKELLAYEKQPDYIHLNINGNVDLKQLSEFVKKIDSKAGVKGNYNIAEDSVSVYESGSIIGFNDLSKGKEIITAITKQYDNITATYVKPYIITNRQLRALPTYKGEYREAIEKYISDNDINMTVQNVDYSDVISSYQHPELMSEREWDQYDEIELISETEMSAKEVLEFENELYNATGIQPIWRVLESAMGDSEEYNGKDVLNGDANCDKGVGLADALAILQYVANAEKYPLTTQGLFNADIVGDGDGITPLDALEIQKWDAFKII